MANQSMLESILVVFQNPLEGRQAAYDDWYTNVHIRDAMRLDGAIATQRFIVSDDQLILDGKRVVPGHWAHTLYEWESAAKSVAGHQERAATPQMEITRDADFVGLRDYFYHPRHLSHGWSRDTGFRRGDDILTAMIQPPAGSEAAFLDWLIQEHAPATLSLPGFASVGIFTLHEQQSLPHSAEYSMVAVYGLSSRSLALEAWANEHAKKAPNHLVGNTEKLEVTCWQPRITRLKAEEVLQPSPREAAEEHRARQQYQDRYFTREEMAAILSP